MRVVRCTWRASSLRFHGTCVGLPPNEEEMPETWYCDHCRLSTAVADQRQRIARLLALPCAEGGDDDDDGRDGASGMGELGALCNETETTKQLLLNYLQTNAAADAAADAAQCHHLCEWHAAAGEAHKSLLCDLYHEQVRSFTHSSFPPLIHTVPRSHPLAVCCMTSLPRAALDGPHGTRQGTHARRRDRLQGTSPPLPRRHPLRRPRERPRARTAPAPHLPPQAPPTRRPATLHAHTRRARPPPPPPLPTRARLLTAHVLAGQYTFAVPSLACLQRLVQRAACSLLGGSQRLMHEGGLFGKIERMLAALLSVLKEASPTARVKAIRALREVVKADPATLSLRAVTGSVQAALADPSIAVREGVLDLLGTHRANAPS
jgi:hypothetical protein